MAPGFPGEDGRASAWPHAPQNLAWGTAGAPQWEHVGPPPPVTRVPHWGQNGSPAGTSLRHEGQFTGDNSWISRPQRALHGQGLVRNDLGVAAEGKLPAPQTPVNQP